MVVAATAAVGATVAGVVAATERTPSRGLHGRKGFGPRFPGGDRAEPKPVGPSLGLRAEPGLAFASANEAPATCDAQPSVDGRHS